MEQLEQSGTPEASRAPLVSIVVLTLNSERYIDECLASIVGADELVEIIVIDGGSTDTTIDRVQRHSRPIRIIVAVGASIPQARNIGLATAKGQYILFLDSDDRLRWSSLESVMGLLRRESPSFVVCNNARIDENGNLIGMRTAEYPDRFEGLLRNPVSMLGMVCRRDLLRSVGGFSEDFAVAEDYDLWLRLFEVAQGRKLEVSLAEHRIRPESASRIDRLRTRILGMRASMGAAERRGIRLPSRAALAGYWYLRLIEEVVAGTGIRPTIWVAILGERIRPSAAGRRHELPDPIVPSEAELD